MALIDLAMEDKHDLVKFFTMMNLHCSHASLSGADAQKTNLSKRIEYFKLMMGPSVPAISGIVQTEGGVHDASSIANTLQNEIAEAIVRKTGPFEIIGFL